MRVFPIWLSTNPRISFGQILSNYISDKADEIKYLPSEPKEISGLTNFTDDEEAENGLRRIVLYNKLK